MGTYLPPDIGLALFGRTRLHLLGILFGDPGRMLYLRELTRILRRGHGSVQRELLNLERAGLIVRSRQGRQVYFQANRACPVFHELQQLVVKTVGLGDMIRKALAGLRSRIDASFVFGSFARGQQRASSDVDLMVIGDVPFPEVVAALSEAQRDLNREINPSVFPLQEVVARFRQGQPFMREVFEGPKIFILGDDRELERLVTERMAGEPHRQQG